MRSVASRVSQRLQRKDRARVPVGGPRVAGVLEYDASAAEEHPSALMSAIGDAAGRLHIDWVLRHLDVNVVLDVGANVGDFGHRIRSGGYEGRIISFEPVPAVAAELRERASGDPEWRVEECALGDTSGTQHINARPGKMSSLLPTSDFGGRWRKVLNEVETIPIAVRRLDELWEDLVADVPDPRVFLKLDTQGFDLHAFRGAGVRVREVRGLQSELSCLPIYDGMPRWNVQLATYEAAGFELSGFFPVSYHGRTARAIEFDVVMVRSSS